MKRPTRPRRGRGRPRKDAVDLIVVVLAAAFAEVYRLGPHAARDLALAFKEGHAREIPSDERAKLPRRFRRAGWMPLKHELPVTVPYKGREGAIAEKLNRGKIKPRPDVVRALAQLLRVLASKDMAATLAALSAVLLKGHIFPGRSKIESVLQNR
jgi:hypothetical protein